MLGVDFVCGVVLVDLIGEGLIGVWWRLGSNRSLRERLTVVLVCCSGGC